MSKEDVLKISFEDLARELKSSEGGLSTKEADKRIAEYGPNILKRRGVNALRVLGRQFNSSLIYLLIAASAISYGIRDYSDGTVILIILLINTMLGFFQEYRSDKVIEKLSKFITTKVRIKREGRFVLSDQSQIAPGDVIMIREGDIAPADLRLFEADDLQINESQLTGESVPVIKRPTDGSAKTADSIVYAGSTIEKGEGQGLVYATGKNTQLGTIAVLSTQTKRVTQYEQSLQSLSSFLIKVTLAGLGLVFVSKLFLIFMNRGTVGFSALLLFIIAMAVAVVPEVLPIIAMVTLSNGALKLAKKHVVVKRLTSLEDLGNVDLLCTDKTGTLTENKMVVNSIVSINDDLFQQLAYASITPLKTRKHRLQNTYDDAFDKYIAEPIKNEARNLEIVKELPFDPDDRRSRTVLENVKTKKHYLVSMGAPESLLKIADGNEDKAKYMRDIIAGGKEGLHHLAIAYKEITYKEGFDILKNENDLLFLGYVSLRDPLRPSVKNTIQLAEKLGIKIKILTGDSKEVAEYIGRQVGLVTDGDKVYVGDELDKMSQSAFKIAVHECNVFARVSPTQKFNIIKALKETNVVAYQGDGINDAPSLKLADVAIAVNSATDIAKEDSDIVLLNKSLDVIINGIDYGRSIFVNINKYIKYTMVSNFGNFIALSVLYLVSANLPLLPVQVLLTSVITDIPLITISSDSVEGGEVVKPEKQNVRELIFISLILGVPTALFEVFYFTLIRSQAQPIVQTSLYVFLTFLALAAFYVVRNKGSFLKAKPPSSLMDITFMAGFVVSLGIIYISKFQSWFYFVPLGLMPIGIILVLVLIYLFAADFVKVWYYRFLARA